MDDDDTLGLEKLTMSAKKKAKSVKRRPRGNEKAKIVPTPAVGDEGLRRSLRSQVKNSQTREPVIPQFSSAVPSYTPLDIPPLGLPADATAQRYMPPHLRQLPVRQTHAQSSKLITPIREYNTRSKQALQTPEPQISPAKSKDSTKSPQKAKKTYFPSSRPPPSPTQTYLAQSAQVPTRLSYPQKLLIVLDLNGTLIHRKRKHLKTFTPRPYLKPFLDYIFKEHSVMVWSSARPENVALMCNYLFTKEQRQSLVAEWGRDTLGLTQAEYAEKVQVYKRLSLIWKDVALQKRSCPGYEEGRVWGQMNTILIDDGLEKGRAEPWNFVEVPEFEGLKGGRDERGDVDDLAEVLCWIEEARWWSDVSAFSNSMGMRFGIGKDWGELSRRLSAGEVEEGGTGLPLRTKKLEEK